METNKNSMHIGSRTEGDVPKAASVIHNSNVTISTPKCNTYIENNVVGKVHGIVEFGGNINVVASKSSNNQPQPSDNCGEGRELKRIGDTTIIRSTAGETISCANTGSVTIARKGIGKISTTLRYKGDGHEYTERRPLSGSSDVETSHTNVGSVIMAGECNKIIYSSDVVVGSCS